MKNPFINYFILVLLFLMAFDKELISQVQPDSIWNEQEIEQELYEINLLKFKRLLRNNDIDKADSTFKNQILRLTHQFIELADQKKYSDANFLLESALSLLSNWENSNNEILDADSDLEITTIEKKSRIDWFKEVSFGSDIWKQEFELAIPEYDSMITEKVGNPFTQFRLGFDYYQSKYFLKLNGSYKSSRDYDAMYLNFNSKNMFSENKSLTLENRFEGTNYKQNFDLAYWQNELSADLELKDMEKFSVEFVNKFLIRKNRPQSFSYADYLQNRTIFNSSYHGNNLLISGNYELENRTYSVYSEKDYHEHQIGLNFFNLLAFKHNIHFDIKYRYRDYSAAYSDTTFNNDYGELYSQFSSTFRLSDRLSLQLENALEYRHYAQISTVMTDYLGFEIEPAFVVNIKELWSVEIGYIYSFRNYKESTNIFMPSILEQDYFSNGISISLDIFEINKFMLSITNIYSLKRYPKSAAKNINRFTLYTDRNNYSLLCYLSYNITTNLELGLIVNYDDDRDPYRENSDARSTMFSLELSYHF